MKAKTRRRRLVPITPQLRVWLDVAREVGSKLPVRNFPNKFNRIRWLAKVFDGWPHDRMRHSFASYHLAKHRNENETAMVGAINGVCGDLPAGPVPGTLDGK